jgi:hypothetical protein
MSAIKKNLAQLGKELSNETLTPNQQKTIAGGQCDKRRRVLVNASTTGNFGCLVTLN